MKQLFDIKYYLGLFSEVVDLENGRLLGPNKDGEICIKSPSIMKGYFGRQESTAQTIDSEGWMHTGM